MNIDRRAFMIGVAAVAVAGPHIETTAVAPALPLDYINALWVARVCQQFNMGHTMRALRIA